MDLKLEIRKGERLADQLYGQLLEKIVSGQLIEGDKLPSENEISRAFNVSRPVIREALLRLQADGLVYSRQGAGSFVRARPPEGLIKFAQPSDVASLLRCFEARLPVEGAAAALAAQRASPEDIERIEQNLTELEAALNTQAIADQVDFAFHLAVARASGNDFFVSIMTSLNTVITSGIKVTLNMTQRGSNERIQKVFEEHRAIFEAISTGDATGADLAMRYHIHQARARATDRLRDR
ncbi:MAG: FadR/GntR family transcriptional regulator [Pseudomonadota bacterium]